MAQPRSIYLSLILVIVVQQIVHIEGLYSNIGVCYGTLGDNLPSPTNVLELYGKYLIPKVRLFNPNPEVQEALRHTSFLVALGVENKDLANLALSQDAANTWVQTNIIPYKEITYEYVTVGNEAVPGENAQYIAPAMKNIRSALDSVELNQVTVTTVVSSAALGVSYPPSQGAFTDQAVNDMTSIISFLASEGSGKKVLMINVYPYFAYVADPDHINLDYAQFFATFPVFKDGDLSYFNLFDATVDAFYSAMDKVGGANVGVTISETGWPSAGNENFTTPDLAQRYFINFMEHTHSNGTPKRPNDLMDGFIFAMFNENQKPAGVEQNFGLFYPTGEPVYTIPLMLPKRGV